MKKIVLGLIKIYQYFSKFTPSVCRFTPTCSEYTKQAIMKYGVIKGGWLGIKRICRCHPWNPGGYDPVPQGEGANFNSTNKNNEFIFFDIQTLSRISKFTAFIKKFYPQPYCTQFHTAHKFACTASAPEWEELRVSHTLLLSRLAAKTMLGCFWNKKI